MCVTDRSFIVNGIGFTVCFTYSDISQSMTIQSMTTQSNNPLYTNKRPLILSFTSALSTEKYKRYINILLLLLLYLVCFQQIMFKLGKLTDFKEPLQLPCWRFSLAFSCSSKCAKTRRMGQENKTAMLIPSSRRPSCTFFRSPQPHKARKGRRRPGERGRHERVPWDKLWFLIGSVAMLVMFSLFSFYLFMKL